MSRRLFVKGVTRGEEKRGLPRRGVDAAGEHVGFMRLVICKTSLVSVQKNGQMTNA